MRVLSAWSTKSRNPKHIRNYIVVYGGHHHGGGIQNGNAYHNITLVKRYLTRM